VAGFQSTAANPTPNRRLVGIQDVIRLTVVYWADRADRASLADESGVGAFAKRTPHRPNPLNVCPCTLLGRESRRLRVRGLDAVDGSAVLDLKPALQAER
jgi:tRNA (Thr-GGU) A37 N-methylase